MAGIIASSTSRTMTSGETSSDKTVTGYVTREQITLTAYPAGTTYVWSLAKPTASGSTCQLSATTGTSVTVTPDVEGYYVVSANVDGTAYVLRAGVAAISNTSTISAIRFLPLTNAQVPTPSTAETGYWSSTLGALSLKDSTGTVRQQARVTVTTATPEGSVVGSPGDFAVDSVLGNAYVKATGVATNTGWKVIS